MQRKISLAVMAIMLFLMAAANSQAEETREPPKLLWFNNEETENLWAEMMGFQDPVERLVIKKHYDSFSDLINDYHPDFMDIFTYRDETPKMLYNAGLIEPFAPTNNMLEEISSMSPLIQQVFRTELMTEDGQLLAYPASGHSITFVPGFIGYWVPGRMGSLPLSGNNVSFLLCGTAGFHRGISGYTS